MIVGISGAIGTTYGLRILEVLRLLDIETHLVMSKPAAADRSGESHVPYL
ncbi:hypothetical protein Msil_2938 [Methylocella silvestris BL2]|uniref:Flavoprotein domain-containing protein n=1 Tax=Methylocella silvestris (strain DSM 15510 / CIP 108128 / LMG 27833 / NCIMB 13906 / BL2) TaxID=395965 RepID=B8EIN7_METSB|nr:flavoprotein [Methylocella silvestris]ACK51854.1 hypothetical protein Msil_2938 [Methylocella silvestris BL2]